ncbi:MAG: polymer-forming cytoskeletal protein [Odoribacter sp.]|nr:polymer-forming cytoskeletal protein [Odoribacter sp.]
MKGSGSFILDGVEIKGNIRSEKDILLQGKIKGEVRCNAQLMVEKQGIVEGDVYCDDIQVEGVVNGNVHVKNKAVLSENGIIKGYLITACLQIHPNSTIEKGIKFIDK